MALNVRRRDGSIEVETSRLRLELDLTRLTLSLRTADGALGLSRFRPRALTTEGPVYATEPILDGYGEIRTRSGLATRIQARCRANDQLELSIAIDVADDWPGIALELGVANRGDTARRVTGLEPLHWSRDGGGELALPGDPGEIRVFRMGYQSWSPSGFLPLAGRDRRPRIPLVRTIHFGPFTPLPERGFHVSDFVTALRAPGQAGLTVGFLSHFRFFDWVSMRHRNGRVTELCARVVTEGLELAPRSHMEGERLWVGLDAAREDGLATWASRAGREMQAPVPAHAGSGWCSWYQYFTKVSEADVRSNVASLSTLNSGLETIQIDDGYQPAVGDWLDPSDGFPEGLAPLAAEIRQHGFRAGVWLAPFLVSPESRVAQRHPDWLLRGRSGRPRVAAFNPAWKGRSALALDPTHPEVQGWLEEVTRTLRGQGFDYFKLDFLYAAALPGARKVPDRPSAEAYRSGLAAIRRASEPDHFLVGCGAPLGPSIGLVDAMRVGPDVAPRWRAPLADLLFGIPAAPSALNSIRGTIARAPLHQRLWLNDPDCVLLRDRDTRLNQAEVQTLAGVAALAGGLILFSDDMDRVGPERRRLMRRLVPATGRAPETRGLRGEIPTELWTRFPDGSALVLVVNFGWRAGTLEISLVEPPLDGAVHVYDVWGERSLGIQRGSVRIEGVPPHGSALLRLCPADASPRVVGSSLHVSGGALETARIRAGANGRLTVKLELPGRREGRLEVFSGRGSPVPVHVGFEGELELSLEGVEDSSQIPDP